MVLFIRYVIFENPETARAARRQRQQVSHGFSEPRTPAHVLAAVLTAPTAPAPRVYALLFPPTATISGRPERDSLGFRAPLKAFL